jgi:hypothetical protein
MRPASIPRTKQLCPPAQLPTRLRPCVDTRRNVARISWGDREKNQVPDTSGVTPILKVFYPKDSYKPSASPVGGVGFWAAPTSVFPAEDVTLRYQVAFHDNWVPVRGGMLPGLWTGPTTGSWDMDGKKGEREGWLARGLASWCAVSRTHVYGCTCENHAMEACMWRQADTSLNVTVMPLLTRRGCVRPVLAARCQSDNAYVRVKWYSDALAEAYAYLVSSCRARICVLLLAMRLGTLD